jgi:hypothetical protein
MWPIWGKIYMVLLRIHKGERMILKCIIKGTVWSVWNSFVWLRGKRQAVVNAIINPLYSIKYG